MFMRFVRLFLLFILISMLIAPAAYGGNNCVAVRGVAQEHLLDFSPEYIGLRLEPPPTLMDPWAGPVQLILGQNEVLVGKISEYDGVAGPSNGTGQGKGGSYLFSFSEDDWFIVSYPNAVWPTRPSFEFNSLPGAMTGKFRAAGTVTSGHGRFANTSGNITTDGPFLAWNLYPEDYPDAPLPLGRFNNSIDGSLCGVAPKAVTLKPNHAPPVSDSHLRAMSAESSACQAFHFHESLNGDSYVTNATLGGKPVEVSILGVAPPTDTKYAGNVTFGYESLGFRFADGGFDLVAQYEVIGDMFQMARVNGVGNVANGTGSFTGATGRLNYHGPFAVGATDFSYLDLDYYGQVCTGHAAK
jgi:hypothetical protein